MAESGETSHICDFREVCLAESDVLAILSNSVFKNPGVDVGSHLIALPF